VHFIILFLGGFEHHLLFLVDFILGISFFSLLTWFTRRISTDLENLFDLFKLQKKKFYTSLERKETAVTDTIRGLFKTKKAYDAFRSKARGIICGKTETILLIPAILIWSVLFLLWWNDPQTWAVSPYIQTSPPWTQMNTFVSMCIISLVNILIFTSCTFYLSYMRVINLLGSSSQEFSIWNHIQFLRGEEVPKREGVMSYRNFFQATNTTVGSSLYTITLTVVFLLVTFWMRNFIFMALIAEKVHAITWIQSFAAIPAALLVFLLPQLKIHDVLKTAKFTELKQLREIRSELDGRFVSLQQVLTKYDIDVKTKIEKNGRLKVNHIQERQLLLTQRQTLCSELETFNALLQETSTEGTWAFKSPSVRRVFATSLIPFAVTIIQAVLKFLGII
jgi:hypothetical protein